MYFLFIFFHFSCLTNRLHFSDLHDSKIAILLKKNLIFVTSSLCSYGFLSPLLITSCCLQYETRLKHHRKKFQEQNIRSWTRYGNFFLQRSHGYNLINVSSWHINVKSKIIYHCFWQNLLLLEHQQISIFFSIWQQQILFC